MSRMRLKIIVLGVVVGVGRVMSRSAAIRNLKLEEEKSKLDQLGIIHSIREKSDLEEASSAYKDILQVMEFLKDLVKIQGRTQSAGGDKGVRIIKKSPFRQNNLKPRHILSHSNCIFAEIIKTLVFYL